MRKGFACTPTKQRHRFDEKPGPDPKTHRPVQPDVPFVFPRSRLRAKAMRPELGQVSALGPAALC